MYVRNGKTKNPLYKRWCAMMQRCYLETHKSFKHYGGRGIIVCERWNTFELYAEDIGWPPSQPRKYEFKTLVGPLPCIEGHLERHIRLMRRKLKPVKPGIVESTQPLNKCGPVHGTLL